MMTWRPVPVASNCLLLSSLFFLLVISSPLSAQIVSCPANIDLDHCNANDLHPTGSEVVSGDQACTEGGTFSATVRVRFDSGSGANQRYDLGYFAAIEGQSLFEGGNCQFGALSPITASPSPSDLLSGSGPYADLDGDACGDMQNGAPTNVDVVLEDVPCVDKDGDGQANINYVLTWDNRASAGDCPSAADPGNFEPNPPKCLSGVEVDLPVIVEPPPGITVDKFATPDTLEAPGGEVTYYLTVHNESSVTDPIDITTGVDDQFGDLDGRGTCRLVTIAPGETLQCSFTETVTGDAGEVHTNVVTISGVDDEGEPVMAQDSAQVQIVAPEPDPLPMGSIQVVKTPLPGSLAEPGGLVRYTVTVINPSGVTVTLQGLLDDTHGNLDGRGGCVLPQLLTPENPFYLCQYDVQTTGQPGDVFTSTVTASGVDENSNPVSDANAATVTITNLASAIKVTKTPVPATVEEPGGEVLYVVTVDNQSAVDVVTLDTLVDSVFGDLDGQGNCQLPQTMAAGSDYRCEFTGTVNGVAGDVHTNVISASGVDDDGEAVSTEGAASVQVVESVEPPDPNVPVDPNDPVLPGLAVIKRAEPGSLNEPGGEVTFAIEVYNTSPAGTVTLQSLNDSIYGDLSANPDCALPAGIPVGGEPLVCSFTVPVSGNGGQVETNTVTADGVDEASNEVHATAQAQVVILDVSPGMTARKVVFPREIPAPGEDVTFALLVTNTSPVDTVTVMDMVDSVFGDLNGRDNCSLPQVLEPGQSYACTFVGEVTGESGDAHYNEVLVSGVSDDGDPLSAQASALVNLIDEIVDAVQAIPTIGYLGLTVLGMMVALLGYRAQRRRK